jgi:hypothetical protein
MSAMTNTSVCERTHRSPRADSATRRRAREIQSDTVEQMTLAGQIHREIIAKKTLEPIK